MRHLLQRKVILPLMIILALMLLHYSGALAGVESVVARGMNPVGSGLYSWGTSVKNFFGGSPEKEELRQRIEELKQKNKELVSENAELRYVKEENNKLREFLDFSREKEFDQEMARVVSHGSFISSQENQERILINKGEKDGIKKGAVVLSSKGMVVGKVAETHSSTAEIRFITNQNCELAATIQNRERTMGLIQGELGLTINMNYIPQTETVSVGDRVVTSGLEENIPAGLVIGEVKEVTNSSNEIWQTAVIEPLAELEELTMVGVVK